MAPTLKDSHPFTLVPGAKAPFTVERWVFPNGLTLLLAEDHAAPVFAYQTWFDVGSANERAGRTGIAHLFEHLMFKRTTNHPDGEFDRVMESRGGSSNAATWVDWTFYTSGLPARGDNFDVVAALEADRMEHLVLDVPQVEAEREVVLNERRYRVDNVPDGRMSERLYALAFEKHPYHWPTIGWERDIRAISTDDCTAFYRTWYSPNNATVVVIGDVDGAHVRETIERAYGKLAPQDLPTERFTLDPPLGPRREEMPLTVESEKLLVAWRAPEVTAADRAALSVIETLAFQGQSSRVTRRLVDELSIAAECSSMLTPFKYPGLFEVKIDVAFEHVAEEAERELEAIFARFATEDVPRDELAKAVNQIELGFYGGLRTTSDKAEALGHHHVTMGDYRRLFQEVARVQAVTPADIRRVASAVFRPENRTTIVGRVDASGESAAAGEEEAS